MAGNFEDDDLNRPPNDMGKLLEKMLNDEALGRNTLKMAQGMLREGYMNDEFGANFVENFEVPARLVTNTVIVEHYASRGKAKDALRVFMHMSVSGVEPNAYCYSIMIRALAAAADLKKNPNFIVYAKKYFVEMLGKGMQPNEETYLAVLEGIGRGKNKAKAEEERKEFSDYVKAMGFLVLFKKDIEERAKHPSSKSETDMLKEHVMKVFKDATKDCEDKDVQERFQRLGKDYETLSYTAVKLFQTLVQIGLVEETNYLLKPLLETGIMPDEAVFTIVMHLYASGKTKSNALKVYEQMLAYGITPSSCTYNLLIGTLARDPKFLGHAKKYFLEMLEKGMKPFPKTPLTKDLLKPVKPKEVLPDADESRIRELMKAMKLYDDLDKKTTDNDAKEVIRKIKLNGFDEELAKMVHAMVQDGNAQEVAELFPSTGHPRINPMVIIYTAVMESYIIGGKTKGAFRTYLDMLAAGLAPISYTYSVLVKGLAAEPKFFGVAKKYLIEMLDKGMRPSASTYTAVIEGFERDADKATENGKKFLEVMMVKGLYLTLTQCSMS